MHLANGVARFVCTPPKGTGFASFLAAGVGPSIEPRPARALASLLWTKGVDELASSDIATSQCVPYFEENRVHPRLLRLSQENRVRLRLLRWLHAKVQQLMLKWGEKRAQPDL